MYFPCSHRGYNLLVKWGNCIMKEKNFNKEKALQLFEKFKLKAKKIIEDPRKVETILRQASETEKKAEGPFGRIMDDFRILTSLVRDWAKGDYKEIPTGSIIAIVAGILYFVSPIDLIPDFIVALGFLDDVFIISTVIKQIQTDLDCYKEWKRERIQ